MKPFLLVAWGPAEVVGDVALRGGAAGCGAQSSTLPFRLGQWLFCVGIWTRILFDSHSLCICHDGQILFKPQFLKLYFFPLLTI